MYDHLQLYASRFAETAAQRWLTNCSVRYVTKRPILLSAVSTVFRIAPKLFLARILDFDVARMAPASKIGHSKWGPPTKNGSTPKGRSAILYSVNQLMCQSEKKRETNRHATPIRAVSRARVLFCSTHIGRRRKSSEGSPLYSAGMVGIGRSGANSLIKSWVWQQHAQLVHDLARLTLQSWGLRLRSGELRLA